MQLHSGCYQKWFEYLYKIGEMQYLTNKMKEEAIQLTCYYY